MSKRDVDLYAYIAIVNNNDLFGLELKLKPEPESHTSPSFNTDTLRLTSVVYLYTCMTCSHPHQYKDRSGMDQHGVPTTHQYRHTLGSTSVSFLCHTYINSNKKTPRGKLAWLTCATHVISTKTMYCAVLKK